MNLSRRGFLGGVGAAAAAAAMPVAVVAQAFPEPSKLVMELLKMQAEINRRHSQALFMLGDTIYNGVIVREVPYLRAA